MRSLKSVLRLAAAAAFALAGGAASAQGDVSFDLKYGVLAGFTGDPAAAGRPGTRRRGSASTTSPRPSER